MAYQMRCIIVRAAIAATNPVEFMADLVLVFPLNLLVPLATDYC